MLTHEIIAVLFRLINFAVIIALAIYGFKKYVITMVQAQIAARQQYLADLLAQAQQLQAQGHVVDRATETQETLYKNLDTKLIVWQSVFNKTMQEREAEQATRIRALHEKAVVQNRYIASKLIERDVVPLSIDDATTFFAKKYAAPDAGHQYIATIINHIKKS